MDSLIGWLVAAVVAGIIVLVIYALIGINTKCDKCKRWFAEESVKKERVDARTGYQTREVETTQRNPKGEIISTSQTERQFKILTETWRNHYRCKYCDCVWTTITSTKTESYVE